PQPVLAQRADVRSVPRHRRPVVLRQHPARVRSEQRAGSVVSLAVRERGIGRGARRPRSGYLVLQPITAGRVRGVWRRRGRRVARRRSDPRDGELIRGPASGGSGGTASLSLPERDALRDQGAARGDGVDPQRAPFTWSSRPVNTKPGKMITRPAVPGGRDGALGED